MSEPVPLMYDELAGWFHLLSSPDEYVDEAAEVMRLLRESIDGPFASLLELGSGGGNLASHLGADLRLTLTDPQRPMLDLSRTINPAAEHIVADMRTLRLDRRFDAVLVHDAIVYMRTEADLRAAFDTAYVHLRPGGAALFMPDWVLDSYEPKTEQGGTDVDGRGVRYLEWDRPLAADGRTVITDYVIVTREADGATTVHHDEHRLGIFPRATWMRLLTDAGLAVRHVMGEGDRDLFIGTR